MIGETKKCVKCSREMDLFHFIRRRSSTKSGWLNLSKCKSCRDFEQKQWYLKNRDRLYYVNKKYRQSHKEIYRISSNIHYHRNRSACRQRNRIWIKNNLKRLRENYHRRNKSNPMLSISNRMRARIHSALKRSGTYKNNRTFEIIGCSKTTLKKHLESLFLPGMSWENRGKWHIDHIVPIAAFDLLNESEFLAAFHYKNLQPLWASDNLAKGCKVL